MIEILTILILDTVVISLVCIGYTSMHKKAHNRTTDLAQARLLYIRSTIHLVYTYSHQPELMLQHLKTEMSIRKILNYRIIEDHCERMVDDRPEIRQPDKLLYMLHKEGFTPQELCVIFNLNNLNTVYVKCHRVRQKLKSRKDDSST